MIRNEACYLYRAKEVGTSFTLQLDLQLSAIDVNSTVWDRFLTCIWIICENPGRPAYVDVGKNVSLWITEKGNSTTTFYLYLTHKDDIVQDSSVDLDVGTTYYLTITRESNVYTVKIYSDSSRTTLVDTISIDVTGQDEETLTFSYIETTASQDSALDGNDQSDGFIENLCWVV